MDKLSKLRAHFEDLSIDGMLVTSASNRRYMTGFTGTAGTVLISGEEAKFITDFRYVAQANDQAMGYEVVENRDAIEEVARHAPNMGITRLGFEQDHLSYRQFKQFNEHVKAEFVPVSGVVEQIRTVKSEWEINILKTAAEIADQAFTNILEYIRPGVTEMDINNKLEFDMRKEGATSSSFDTIVASGYRSAMPHGVASNKVVEKGDIVTMDFGAYYQGYCSDMTRTVAVGEPQGKMKHIYDIVHDALRQGTECLRAGMTCKEVDSVARNVISEAGYGEEFGHGTGHSIGLDIHEDPYFSQKSEDILEAHNVMTVEPGIYLPGTGGVRIEDDVLITEDSHRVLTHSPTHLIVL